MSIDLRSHVRATAAPLTIAALIALAGCASKPGGTASAGGAAAPVQADKPGSYAVIDGNKAPIPKVAMGDAATVAKIIDEGKNRNRVMDHLTYLSNDIGTRLTGSSNVDRANKWGRDQFEKWGLSIPPFAAAEGITVSTDPSLRGLWQWNTVPVRFDRGPSSGKVVSARNPGSENPDYRTLRDMELTTLAWTTGTNGPVRGHVVKMPETDAQFDAVKDQVKGSWVIIKPNAAGRRGITGSASGRLQALADIRKKWKSGKVDEAPVVDKDMTHYEGTLTGGFGPDGIPFTLDVKLTDPKAVTGKLVVGNFRTSELKDATLTPETGQLKFKVASPGGGDREITMKLDGDSLKGEAQAPGGNGVMSYAAKKVAAAAVASGPSLEERMLQLQPAGWVIPSGSELVLTGGAPGWDKLEMETVSPDVIVTVRKSDYDCMNSALADGVSIEAEFDLKNVLTKGPFPVYNTIAEIKGTQWPDEVIIVSGHLDSWNGPGAQGTTDNGTGSSVTLEAARILAAVKAKPKRTIRFVLWTGEEQGLLGSVAYVKQLKATGALEKISAVLVDDGGTNYEGGLPCVDSQVDFLAAATAPVNGHFYSETDKKFMDVNIHRGKTFTQVNGSDHNSFMREKVSGFFWDEVGRADYNHTHHTQFDHLDQAIPEYLVQSSTCAAVTAYNLACAPTMLPRPADDQWPVGGRGASAGRGGAGGAGAPGNGPGQAPGTPAAPGTAGGGN